MGMLGGSRLADAGHVVFLWRSVVATVCTLDHCVFLAAFTLIAAAMEDTLRAKMAKSKQYQDSAGVIDRRPTLILGSQTSSEDLEQRWLGWVPYLDSVYLNSSDREPKDADTVEATLPKGGLACCFLLIDRDRQSFLLKS